MSSSTTSIARSQSPALFLTVVYAMTFVAAFNENIVNVALLKICPSFSITQATGQWLITGYMVVASVITAATGFLSRRFSTRGLFLCAAGCMAAGELACLVAPSFGLLLPARLLQAVGSGILFPLMMNVVMAVAPRERLGVFLAIGAACITLGPAFGPVLAGVADTLFGWRAIFVLPGLCSIALGALGVFAVRDISTTEKVRADVPSVLLLALGFAGFVWGVGEMSASVLVAVVAIAAAVVLIALFCRRQNRLPEPFLDVRVLANLGFWPAAVLSVVAMMMSFSMSVLLPLYYEGSFGATSLAAGLLILTAIAVNAATSVLGGRVMDRKGPWPLLPLGMVLILAAMAVIVGVAANLVIGLVAVTLLSVVAYAGVGFVMSPSQTAGLASLPSGQTRSGTAVINTLIMVSASVGASLFVGVLSGGAAEAQAQGATMAEAQAAGFGSAVLLAAAIALVGLGVAAVYARRQRGLRG